MSYEEIRSKHVKTRKEHLCSGCLIKQPKGSTLWYRAYIWDGEFTAEYNCKNCEEVIDNMEAGDLMDGWCQGDLINSWTDEQMEAHWAAKEKLSATV